MPSAFAKRSAGPPGRGSSAGTVGAFRVRVAVRRRGVRTRFGCDARSVSVMTQTVPVLAQPHAWRIVATGIPAYIPLVVLLLIAVVAGFAAALVARRYHAPRGPSVETRVARHARLDPEELTGLALTVALVLSFGGGILL